jgi:hypothetical protein
MAKAQQLCTEEDIRHLVVEKEMLIRRVRGAIRETQVGPHCDRIVVEDMLDWLDAFSSASSASVSAGQSPPGIAAITSPSTIVRMSHLRSSSRRGARPANSGSM